MIELTDQQLQQLARPAAVPPRIINPRTKETFVLLQIDEYERLKHGEYDDAPWTRKEIEAVAWETAERGDWDEYDDAVEEA